MSEFWIVGLFIVLGIVLIAVMPLAAIWAVNMLFGTMIPYTFKTWLASLILSGVVAGNVRVNTKN
jgi:hypothetical protein